MKAETVQLWVTLGKLKAFLHVSIYAQYAKVPEFNFISSEFIVVIKKLFQSAELDIKVTKNYLV